MSRQQMILAAVLAIQILLIGVVFWPRQTAVGAGEPIFPDLETEDIVALTITDPDGNQIELRKEGEAWVLPDAEGFPAEEEKITPVLEQITSLTSSRLVTRTPGSHKRLQVAADDFVRRFDFETADGAQRAVLMGSAPQYGATHFRVEGQDKTYLTADFSTWDTRADAAAWIDTTYVALEEAEVQRMTLDNASGSLTFTRDEDDNWTMEGLGVDETLDQAKVDSVLRKAASITMKSPLGKEEQPEYGMDRPNAVVELETAEATITIHVGALDPEDETYVVGSSESPYYVQVAQYSVQDLVQKDREGFLQLPPTPTPEQETDASSG
jgi:hypothetical protein